MTTGEESKHGVSRGVLILSASEPPTIGFAEEYPAISQDSFVLLSLFGWEEVCLLHICTCGKYSGIYIGHRAGKMCQTGNLLPLNVFTESDSLVSRSIDAKDRVIIGSLSFFLLLVLSL